MEQTQPVEQNPSSPQTVQHIEQQQPYETPISQTELEIDRLMQMLELGSEDLLKQADVEKQLEQMNLAAVDCGEDEQVCFENNFDADVLDSQAILPHILVSLPTDQCCARQTAEIEHRIVFYYDAASQYCGINGYEAGDLVEENIEESKAHFSENETDAVFECESGLDAAFEAKYLESKAREVEFDDSPQGVLQINGARPVLRICTGTDVEHIECDPPDDSSGFELGDRPLAPLKASTKTTQDAFFDDDSTNEAENVVAAANECIIPSNERTSGPVFYYQAVHKNVYIEPSSSGIFKTTLQSQEISTENCLPDTQSILLELEESHGFQETAATSNAFSHGEQTRRAENVKIDTENQMDITDITENDVEVYSMTEYEEQAPTVLYQPNQVEQFDPFLKSPEKEATEPLNSQTNKIRVKFRWSQTSSENGKVLFKLFIK